LSAKIYDFNLKFNAETVQFKRDVDVAKNMLRGYTNQAHAANDSNVKLSQSLEQSADKAKSFGQGFLTVTGSVTAGLGVLAGATGLLITRQADQAREMLRMSTVAQQTVEDMQGLAYATEEYGISGEKMSDILKDVNDKLGDLTSVDGGEFKDFFEEVAPLVNVTAEELSNLSSDQVLVRVKEAMDAANIPMKEQISYLEKIANDASALIPLLNNKGEKLYELKRRYDDLNVSMSEYDYEQFKEMDQNLRDAGLKLEYSFATAVIGARDQINWLTEQLNTAVTWWGELFDSWTDDPKTRGGLIKKLGELRSEIKPMQQELKALEADYSEINTWNTEVDKSNPWLKAKKESLSRSIATLKAEMKPVQTEIDKLQNDYQVRYLGMSDAPPPVKTGGDSGNNNTNGKTELTDISQLSTFDNLYAEELGKLNLSHRERLAAIEGFNFTKQEIEAKGYSSIAELRDEYLSQEKAYHEEKIDEYLTRQEEELAAKLKLISDNEDAITAKKEQEAERRKQTEERINSQLTSMQMKVAGEFLGIIEETAKEGGSIQKAAFLLQKSLAAAQVLIQGEVAASAMMTPPPLGLGPIAGATPAALMRGMAAASAGMIMGQAIAGMAHSGMDYIPNEGTWLLDKGERVYTNESARQIDQMYKATMAMYQKTPAANHGLYNAQPTPNGKSGGNIISFEQHFHMSGSEREQVNDAAEQMQNAVKNVLQDEMRPGGMLSGAI
jgi:hypothetical protein